MEDLATFAHAFPSWCGGDGLPLSYRHYRYGMTHLGRDDARATLRLAIAGRMSQAGKDDFAAWRRHLRRLA